ncbi:serine/threonine protein kinase [Bacillus benzoevorans]|uniref:Serine/threonine-protein kinase n=1 Tax=Bacillus benzoevorans TaxID=1456 RepID=A0A7X0HTJ7_9BACI|nr:protein kinase [Bacillus benzoevorans]MBB6446536.1 serine/threonine-protein kinase [Bacillus benzoevorans]
MLKSATAIAANLLERPLKIGKVIEERYEIITCLGRGSYGISYHVFDRIKQTPVVLKSLRVHKRILKSGKKAFEEEQKLLQSINHPYFPIYYEKGNMGRIPFYTMEYVSGKTFEQLIFQEGRKYSEKETFQIGLELLQIMKWLHQHGIIHRDIRIPNVMIENEKLRLIDFGLACTYNDGVTQQLDRDHIKRMASPISDFYALGHFLLFLLYSTYEDNENSPKKSWEEELALSGHARLMIRKLLAIDEPYRSCSDIEHDIVNLLSQ